MTNPGVVELPDGVSINDGDGCVDVEIPEDVDVAYELYSKNPVFHHIVQKEIRNTVKAMGYEPQISRYCLMGWFYDHRGEKFSVPKEHIGLLR